MLGLSLDPLVKLLAFAKSSVIVAETGDCCASPTLSLRKPPTAAAAVGLARLKPPFCPMTDCTS